MVEMRTEIAEVRTEIANLEGVCDVDLDALAVELPRDVNNHRELTVMTSWS